MANEERRKCHRDREKSWKNGKSCCALVSVTKLVEHITLSLHLYPNVYINSIAFQPREMISIENANR